MNQHSKYAQTVINSDLKSMLIILLLALIVGLKITLSKSEEEVDNLINIIQINECICSGGDPTRCQDQ